MTAKAWTRTTKDLTDEAIVKLKELGFDVDGAVERWEGDGVMIVGPTVDDEDKHWYLSISGSDNEYIDDPGVDVIFIRPGDDETDDHICLTGWEHLVDLLTKEGYLPKTG